MPAAWCCTDDRNPHGLQVVADVGMPAQAVQHSKCCKNTQQGSITYDDHVGACGIGLEMRVGYMV